MRQRLTPPLALVLLLALLTASCSLGGDGPAQGEEKPEATASSSPPPPEGSIRAEFFGMHDHDPASWPKAPVGSLRVWDAGVLWRDVEVSPGVYNFDRLDSIVAAAEQHDAQALIVLGQTPPFHAQRPGTKSFYGPGAASPPSLEAWTAYVQAVATRYAGRPVAFQVWNEANIKGFWKGTPAEMAALTKTAHDVLATVTPRPTLVGPAFVTRLIGQRAWMDSFYAEQVSGTPVADLIDVVSLQLYTSAEGTPQTALDLLVAAKVTLQKYGIDMPIWNTEVNYGLTGGSVPAAPTSQQVSNVVKTLLLNAANGVQRVYWYGWDQQGNVDTLLTEADGVTVSPAGQAYETVREWMLDSLVESCVADAAGTYTCTLRRADGVRRVYWHPGPWPVTLTLPADARGYQVAGEQRRITGTSGTLLIGSVPVMVESAT